MTDDEEVLTGGNMSVVSRVGDTVRRQVRPWTATTQRLLAHVRDHGVDFVPEPLGYDEAGREVVGFLPGIVPLYPMPEYVWRDDTLLTVARMTKALHDATADFDVSGASWLIDPIEPVEVVCHNDIAPYNVVFDDGRPVGLIDFDAAAPGPRVSDLAYLAYRFVPLTAATNPDGIATSRDERMRRIGLLCAAYGDVTRGEVLAAVPFRLEVMRDFTLAEGRRRGNADLLRDAELYVADLAYARTLLT